MRGGNFPYHKRYIMNDTTKRFWHVFVPSIGKVFIVIATSLPNAIKCLIEQKKISPNDRIISKEYKGE
jgi:hypothetical protein